MKEKVFGLVVGGPHIHNNAQNNVITNRFGIVWNTKMFISCVYVFAWCLFACCLLLVLVCFNLFDWYVFVLFMFIMYLCSSTWTSMQICFVLLELYAENHICEHGVLSIHHIYSTRRCPNINYSNSWSLAQNPTISLSKCLTLQKKDFDVVKMTITKILS
jgi:hypothetical protein